ncbi:hypothetical protein EYF80_031747 [Liparis tanakae]|uniref:Uncharacterized protein n=1 Tax=Liparis tanakae TaxID=230148 RepID=A0A4Z2GY89_9TELE|nr:hypothetical protein EYF80_031747 [Liparis tanakae]
MVLPHLEYTCCLPLRPHTHASLRILQLFDKSRGFTTDHGETMQMRNPSTMRIWIPSSESDTPTPGDRLTPWERANLTGFSCQPFTVLTMASMSMASITDTEEREQRASLHMQRTLMNREGFLCFDGSGGHLLSQLMPGIFLRGVAPFR